MKQPDRTSSNLIFFLMAAVGLIGLLVAISLEERGVRIGGLILTLLFQITLLLAVGIMARNVEDIGAELREMKDPTGPEPRANEANAPEPASRWEAVWQAHDRQEG
jgi:hypothetical protein